MAALAGRGCLRRLWKNCFHFALLAVWIIKNTICIVQRTLNISTINEYNIIAENMKIGPLYLNDVIIFSTMPTSICGMLVLHCDSSTMLMSHWILRV